MIRILLVVTVGAGILFTAFPQIDLGVAALAFGPERLMRRNAASLRDAQRALSLLVGVAIALFTVLWLVATASGRPILRLDSRRLAFVLLTFVLAPGLLVPLTKVIFQRPRPEEIVRFGGPQPFVRALVPGARCADDCASFPSGEVSAAFSFVSVGLAAGSPAAVTGALLLGTGVGVVRMLQGRHFLSDVVFAALLTLLTVLCLYAAVVEKRRGRDSNPR